MHELAETIDSADAALGDFKRRQAAAYRSLVEQEERLEEELAAVASGLMCEGTATAAAISSEGPAPNAKLAW